MKKWKIIFPSLLATTSIPLVSLTACGNNSKPVEELKPHIYFNNGGHGTLTGDLDIEIAKGTKWCDLVTEGKTPIATGTDGWTFAGWYKGETKLEDTDTTKINENWSVTARFNEPPQPEPTGIELSKTEMVLNKGETNRLFARVEPEGASQQVVWSSDDEETAVVDGDGKVTAKEMGETTIRVVVQSHQEIYKTCTVTVNEIPVPTEYSVTLINPTDEGFSIKSETAIVGQDFDEEISSSNPMNSGAVDYVLVDGQSITGWTFQPNEEDSRKGILHIPADKIKGQISIHCLKDSDPVPYNFETDPWETVAFFANQGLDALCDAYDKEPSWFIGKTKELKINGQKYVIRVIGTEQDTYTKNNVRYNAALTLQFNTLISDKNSGKYLRIDWDSNNENKNYWNGPLENALNGEGAVEWKDTSAQPVPAEQQKSVYQMMKATDPMNKWTKYIKTVDRTVNIYDDNKWTPTQKQSGEPVRLFVPTISNIFSVEGIQEQTDFNLTDEHKDLLCAEGPIIEMARQYQYYALSQNIGSSVMKAGFEYECLRFTDCAGTEPTLNIQWWLSSPSLAWNTAWSVYTTGKLGHLPTLEIRAVAPCFCL